MIQIKIKLFKYNNKNEKKIINIMEFIFISIIGKYELLIYIDNYNMNYHFI